jgi:hypothetical protein
MGCSAPQRIVNPALWEVQFPIQQRMSIWAGVCQEHTDLTIFNSPGCTTVLPLDADRFVAFFEETGLINNGDRIGSRKRLPDIGG